MTCPECCGETIATNTRKFTDHILRYRKCQNCGYIFRTVEIDEDMSVRLKKGENADVED